VALFDLAAAEPGPLGWMWPSGYPPNDYFPTMNTIVPESSSDESHGNSERTMATRPNSMTPEGGKLFDDLLQIYEDGVTPFQGRRLLAFERVR